MDMSVVTIQIGQCGNQVGYDWYAALARESSLENAAEGFPKRNTYLRENLERWFYSVDDKKLFARSVLIDTEQKVVHDVCKKAVATQMWQYNPLGVVCHKDGGSGNNWALGNNVRGCEMQEAIFNCIRREVETCDRLCTFNNIFSCAGGTGAGLGSRVITHLRDEYPSKCFINSLILPYKGGEIVTQNYNIILTLSKIYDISNIHVIFQNDDLHKMYYDLSGNTHIGLHDLNSLISVKLLSFLQPVNSRTQSHLPYIISDLTPHPCYKIVSVKNTPLLSTQSSLIDEHVTWNVLIKHIMRSLRASFPREEVVLDWKLKMSMAGQNGQKSLTKYVNCVANMLITRGGEGVSNNDTKELECQTLYPEWLPVKPGFFHLHEKEQLLGLSKFVTLISNNSSIHECLNNILERAWMQFSQKAYLHHYLQYGVSEDDVLDAFVKTEDITRYYKDLSVN